MKEFTKRLSMWRIWEYTLPRVREDEMQSIHWLLRRFFIVALIAANISILTNDAAAAPITMTLGSLSGTIDPITYTTTSGTFTTGPITVSLNLAEASFFTIDQGTG